MTRSESELETFATTIVTRSDVDFIAVDTETANRSRDSLCALGVAAVANGTVIATAQQLVDPEAAFEQINTRIHGLDTLAVEGAPVAGAVWPLLAQVCAGRQLVAHNASFDTDVLRRSAERYGPAMFEASITCTQRLARRAWPTMSSYGLAALAREFDIGLDHHHAGSDAAACAEIALRLIDEKGAATIAELHSALEMKPHRLGSTTPPETSEITDMAVCITGSLIAMTRSEAQSLIETAGGIFKKNLSKRVQMLVVGDEFYVDWLNGQIHGKLQKALDLRAAGEGPELIREAEFYRML